MFPRGDPTLKALYFLKCRSNQSKMVCSSLSCFCWFNFMFSGPMMKLVYKLQAEDYKFDFPVSYLPVSKPWGVRAVLGQSSLHSGCGCSGGRQGLRGWAQCHAVCSGPRGHHT